MPDDQLRTISTVKASVRLIKIVIAMAFLATHSTQSALFRLVGRRTAPRFVVLMYHSIKRQERERFAWQMDQLPAVGGSVYADLDVANANGRNFVAVTFDDAYLSVLENALPIMRERGIPATLFVPTQHLGHRPGWITDVRHRNAPERVLTIDELRDVRKSGAQIGSHGATHRPLAQLSPSEVSTELTESRSALGDILGEPVDLLALPYGSLNADVLRQAVRAGYKRVFLNVPVGVTGDLGVDLVGRIEVSPNDWPLEFRLKIRGAYRWLPVAIAAKRQVLRIARALFLERRLDVG